MEAMIQVSEAELEKVREMGVKILCTEENAVLPSPFTHKAIEAEIRRYLHIYGNGRETASHRKQLTESVIRTTNKAMQSDGFLNWEEVWEIIGDCYSEARATDQRVTTKSKKNNEKGMRLCQQRNSSALTARKLQS